MLKNGILAIRLCKGVSASKMIQQVPTLKQKWISTRLFTRTHVVVKMNKWALCLCIDSNIDWMEVNMLQHNSKLNFDSRKCLMSGVITLACSTLCCCQLILFLWRKRNIVRLNEKRSVPSVPSYVHTKMFVS